VDLGASADDRTDKSINIGQHYATRLRTALIGYQQKLPAGDSVIIMALDSATGVKGRLAISYYQELMVHDYVERLEKWYRDFSWFQRRVNSYTDSKGKQLNKVQWLPGIYPPADIVGAIYGTRANDALKKNTIERLLPCIVAGRVLPRDFLQKAFQRTVNRQAYDSGESWLWEKNLGITCGLYRGFSKRNINHMKEYSMALEEQNCSRDYLFGRLLAIAERIEELALSLADEKRTTTAARLMQRFADKPASTWRNIELALQPYVQRLRVNRGGANYNLQQLLDEVMQKFVSTDFVLDKPLSGEFLLAFHTQRLALKEDAKARQEKHSTTETTTEN